MSVIFNIPQEIIPKFRLIETHKMYEYVKDQVFVI